MKIIGGWMSWGDERNWEAVAVARHLAKNRV